MLYVHGTRKACGYLVKGTDVGNNYQYDTPTTVVNLGTYNFSATWNPVSTQFANASWIWTVANANITAPGSSDGTGYYYWFYYTFYYSGSANTGKVYAICDSSCVVYFNSTSVATISNGFGSATATGYNINILNGLNFIRIAAYNSGSGQSSSPTLTISNLTYTQTGNLYSFLGSTGTVVFSSTVSAAVLIGGGGGAGGGTNGTYGGGGGGGGGILSGVLTFIAGVSYTFSVGLPGVASNGGNSYISGDVINEVAPGGGAGGSSRGVNGGCGGGAGGSSRGVNGGCGGGAGGLGGAMRAPGISTGFVGSLPRYGKSGGLAGTTSSSTGGGGGGGAVGAGSLTSSDSGGNGGAGYTWSITGKSYGGGGGGGGLTAISNGGLGQTANNGGGGDADFNATGRTGGGGGASGGSGTQFSGAGGSGLIMISVPSTGSINPAGLLVSVYDAGSVNVANTDSNWVYSQNSTNLSTTTYSNASGALMFNTSAT